MTLLRACRVVNVIWVMKVMLVLMMVQVVVLMMTLLMVISSASLEDDRTGTNLFKNGDGLTVT